MIKFLIIFLFLTNCNLINKFIFIIFMSKKEKKGEKEKVILKIKI